MVVLLRGHAASARHLAVARRERTRERRRMKEHAWKAKRAMLTEQHRNTLSRNRINELDTMSAPRCDAVNVGVRRHLRARLTQFLHSSGFHLFAYAVVSLGVHPSRRWTASVGATNNPAAREVHLVTAPLLITVRQAAYVLMQELRRS